LEKKIKKFPLHYYFDDYDEEKNEDPATFLMDKYKSKIKLNNFEIKTISSFDQNAIMDIIKTLEEEIIL
jgi:hypothetical protein